MGTSYEERATRLEVRLRVCERELEKTKLEALRLRGLLARIELILGNPMMDGSHVPKARELCEQRIKRDQTYTHGAMPNPEARR
jgi:hypothetical protein